MDALMFITIICLIVGATVIIMFQMNVHHNQVVHILQRRFKEVNKNCEEIADLLEPSPIDVLKEDVGTTGSITHHG